MNHMPFDGSCQCSCGAVKLRVKEPLLTRFLCHCTICQSVYKKPFADVTVLREGNLEIDDGSALRFDRLRPPPNVNRGICSKCETPSVGYMSLMPGLKMVFLPTHMLQNQQDAPEPAAHIFYGSRSADVEDALPKHMGYWGSELAVVGLIMPKLFGRKPAR